MKKVQRRLSPAKINLRLDVLGRREDGYHDIESIMTRVSLYDDLSISVESGDGLEVICNGPAPSGEGNIAYRAARGMLDIYGKPLMARIGINKNIPVAAGLGGGSSNAASVLMGINEMLGMGLSREDLMEIGVRLGADVPFFILEKAAIARGIGDRLEGIDLPKIWLVLVNPDIHVSTADVYKGLNLKLGLKLGLTRKGFDINIPYFNDAEGIIQILRNDLEEVAIRMYPDIMKVKEAVLSAGALGALMSGSGATVFGVFDGKEKAEDAFSSLSSRHKNWRSFLAENI